MEPQNKEIYAKEIIAVKDTTYTVAKRKPEKFVCMRMKNDFHIEGWAPTLVLKQRPGGTRKWLIKLVLQLVWAGH